MKRWVAQIALATACVYLALGIGAATCLFSHEAPSETAHHHAGGMTHSPLCVWACQANQSVDQVPAPAAIESLFLISLVVLDGISLPSSVLQYQAQSRAPPQS
jgi:hypothetical protein